MGTYSKRYGKNFRIVYTVEMETSMDPAGSCGRGNDTIKPYTVSLPLASVSQDTVSLPLASVSQVL